MSNNRYARFSRQSARACGSPEFVSFYSVLRPAATFRLTFDPQVVNLAASLEGLVIHRSGRCCIPLRREPAASTPPFEPERLTANAQLTFSVLACLGAHRTPWLVHYAEVLFRGSLLRSAAGGNSPRTVCAQAGQSFQVRGRYSWPSQANRGPRESSTCYSALRLSGCSERSGMRIDAWGAATSRASSAKVLAHSSAARNKDGSSLREAPASVITAAGSAPMGQAVACAISNPGSAGLQPGPQFAHVNTALPRIGLKHEPEERFYPQAYSLASGKVASQGARLRNMAGVSLEVRFWEVKEKK